MTLLNLTIQHLSDEAVAAYADGALRGLAAHRAERHLTECAECAHAVNVQREAAWALRTAPAPTLPGSLLDRLRSVPTTTPLSGPPVALSHDGQPLIAAFGTVLPTAAIVEPAPDRSGHTERTAARPHRGHRLGLVAAATAVVAVGAVAIEVGSTSHPATANGIVQQPAEPVIAPAIATSFNLSLTPGR